MTFLKTALSGAAITMFVATGALVGSTSAVSARIACNRDGDCWHTENRITVPGVQFRYHPDHWYFHQRWDDGQRHYRDYHQGRGYYRWGLWITL